MTAQEQVDQIIILMNPEAKGTTDAVFLVQQFMAKQAQALKAKDVQIAKLEADLEARSQEKHDAINDKLVSETRLKKEKADIIEAGGVLAREGEVPADQKPVGPSEAVTTKQKGKTK
jgi:hypothetical protein